MSQEKKKILVLIDSNAIIHRAYHALPKTMSTSKGELTNVIYGYTTTLVKVLEDLKPDYIAASFDISKATFRVAEYAQYKAHRVKADQELYDQIPRVRQLLEVLNIPVYEMEGFEADDVIGTIAWRYSKENPSNVISTSQSDEKSNVPGDLSPFLPSANGGQEMGRDDKIEDVHVYIVTGDKDAFQLVDGNIEVYDLKRGLSEAQIINSTVIRTMWNLDPCDFIDLKALAGDPSDNIPGVPHIGTKTATDLLIKFDSLVKLYEILEQNFQFSIFNFQSISSDPDFKTKCEKLEIKPRIVGLLIEHKDQAFLSQRLATIRKDVPIEFNLENCRWGDYNKEKVVAFFKEMQFHSLLRRFGIEPQEEMKTKEAKEQKDKDEQLKLL